MGRLFSFGTARVAGQIPVHPATRSLESDNPRGKQPPLKARRQRALGDYRGRIEQDAVMRARAETPTPVDWR
ncbi:hypothetical protein N4G58_11760 [Edwardsiella piscicida]|nr:hypothetical protein N4G58_11760 [Edwardsiella piscicida]